ncbi:aromatic acid exporter family protein [Virgibacillus sp. DJP39]|uniref:aromatic acid exporter family protein n=1 Tax=Virgibacillus sp. DJP39 TaxID=3409790 RepID=UPI003BB66596
MKISQFVGSRVIKTGVAIFLTAWICELLNWPPVFAVITAIVTVEPTVSDSIKKGIIRFPASAIGSAFAVFFISVFGDSPITYTFAAVFTIAICFKLNLHAGLLVATLTSVAMVDVIHSNYLISFFIRLGTTTVGLLVSTAVNMFVLPPHYTKEISKSVQTTAKDTGILIKKIFFGILDKSTDENTNKQEMILKLDKKSDRTEKLVQFQKDESKFHPLVGSEQATFLGTEKQLAVLRMIQYHLDNVLNTQMLDISWSQDERNMILTAVNELAASLQNPTDYNENKHQIQLNLLMKQFWEDNGDITTNNEHHPTHFTPELIILYELVSISNLVTKFCHCMDE